MTGKELWNIAQANAQVHLAGDGNFTKLCNRWIEQRTGSAKALLTHSCTAGLEMAALLADLEPGDEVIMRSYTFVSTANVFVLRGAVPVFVDIRPDTFNLDESLVEAAITARLQRAGAFFNFDLRLCCPLLSQRRFATLNGLQELDWYLERETQNDF